MRIFFKYIQYFTVHISLPKGIIPTTDSVVIKTNAVVLQRALRIDTKVFVFLQCDSRPLMKS